MRRPRSNRLAAFLIAFLASACSGGGGGSGDGGPALLPEEEPLALISPSDGGATRSPNPELFWNPVEGAASYAVSAFADPELTIPIASTTSASPSARFLRRFDDAQRVYVEVSALDAEGAVMTSRPSRFRVVFVPESFPDFRVELHDGRRSQRGYVLFNLQDPLPPDARERVAAMVLVNRAGEVLWWHQRPRGFITDTRVLPNGNLLFIYRPDLTAPVAIEMTWDGIELWRSRDGALPHHEVGLGPDDHYLYLTAIARDVNGRSYEGDGLELVDPATNQVLWSWDIFDHVSTSEVDPVDLALPGLTGLGADWTHSNGAVWDPERSVIWVSVRNLDRMLAVDYPSGAVRGVIGEGGLGGEGFMDHQHSPEVQENGAILYFDNGGRNFPQVSRAAEFQWDEGAGTVTETFEWIDDPPFFDGSVGDADRLANGNVLITSGTANPVISKSARLVEITRDGDVVWDMRVTGGFRLLGFWIYRAEQLSAEAIPAGVLP